MARNTRRKIDELETELQKRDKLIKSLEDEYQTERRRTIQALNIAEHSATAIGALANTLNKLNRTLDEIACKLVMRE